MIWSRQDILGSKKTHWNDILECLCLVSEIVLPFWVDLVFDIHKLTMSFTNRFQQVAGAHITSIQQQWYSMVIFLGSVERNFKIIKVWEVGTQGTEGCVCVRVSLCNTSLCMCVLFLRRCAVQLFPAVLLQYSHQSFRRMMELSQPERYCITVTSLHPHTYNHTLPKNTHTYTYTVYIGRHTHICLLSQLPTAMILHIRPEQYRYEKYFCIILQQQL